MVTPHCLLGGLFGWDFTVVIFRRVCGQGLLLPVRLGTLFSTTWDILFHVSKVLSGRTEVSVAAAVFTLATGVLLLTSNLLGLWLAECTHPAASFLGILGLCEAVIS